MVEASNVSEAHLQSSKLFPRFRNNFEKEQNMAAPYSMLFLVFQYAQLLKRVPLHTSSYQSCEYLNINKKNDIIITGQFTGNNLEYSTYNR